MNNIHTPQRLRILTSLGLAACCIVGLEHASAQREPSWVQQTPTTSPAERTGHAMAFNVLRGSTMMFGGLNTGYVAQNDTWEWVGFNPQSPAPPFRGTWTDRSATTRPSVRYGHAMVWDDARDVITLFGGRSTTTTNNETWKLTATTWSQINPTVRPGARSHHAMAYDSVRQRIVMFGGTDGTNSLADTWEFDGANWAPRFPAAFPTPRSNHAMAFDSERNRVVLFGGKSGSVTFGDTWQFDGTIWTSVSTPVAPSPRADAALIFDDMRGVAVLCGGFSWFQNDDTWEWDGIAWHQRQPQIPRPTPRSAVASFDTTRGRTVLFGGELTGGVRVNDTWEYYFPSGYVTFGSGCSGSMGMPAMLSTLTVPTLLGSVAQLTVTNTPMNAPVFVITGLSNEWWGATPLPVGLGSQGMPGCTLYVSVDLADLVVSSGTQATLQLQLPSSPVFLGFAFYNQALVLDPAAGNPLGAVVTNAGMSVIGN